jgi:two-component system CheB/CheR fusion protein
MNEELQSTNDELHSINDTLRERSGELDEARSFLSSLVNSIAMGMIVVDREMRVVEWNRGCEELWGLRSDEVMGTLLTDLDFGLPIAELKPLIGTAFVDAEATDETRLRAVNRRGRHIDLRVTCTSFRSASGTASGALLLMEEAG